jgi:hypothetical protein
MPKLSLVAACMLMVVFRVLAEPQSDPEQPSFTTLSGKELVKQLADDQTRPRAFYELMRRAQPGRHKDFSAFESHHYNSRVVVCPQDKPDDPIYLVLYGFLETEEPASSDRYGIEKANELFPPFAPTSTEKNPAIEAFTSDGRLIHPFGGNNSLEGTLADINADGAIERVDSMMYGSEFQNAIVLTVSAVKLEAQPLLCVVLNWGDDEWTYRVNDQDGDGISEIEAGPRVATGLIPKAVWKWDPSKRTYAGPTGKAGDHFRVINGAAVWEELKRLKAAKLSFPKDAEAISRDEIVSTETPTPTPAPSAGPAIPNHYVSLKNASDPDLFRFMGEGKSEFYRKLDATHTRLPEDFWTTNAKAAALAYVEANRSEKHRAQYRIAIDDRDKAKPPPRCMIAYSDVSPRCYNAVDTHYFLRVDPEESYLASAGSAASGVTFYNAVYDQPVFDLRICRLSYEDARKIADTIWWLDRVRSRENQTSDSTSRIISTGDGSSHLVVRVDSRPLIERQGSQWSDHIAERWVDDYTPEVFMNFAGFLLAKVLPEHLGKGWSRFEPAEQRPFEMRQTSRPELPDEQRKRLLDFSDQFLDWFSPGEEKISFAIVSEAARLSGEFGISSRAARLREIEASLPNPAPKKRTYSEVSAELAKLASPSDVNDPKKRKKVEARRAALEAEENAIYREFESVHPDHLRANISLALRKLATVSDLEKLRRLAVSSADEGQWALQRLAQVDQKRYADALEELTRKTGDKWKRQFFDELIRADPARAAAMARALAPDKKDALAIPAFLHLRATGAVPDERKRIATIVNLLLDPRTDWLERGQAIDALVPEQDPLHYPEPEIDNALLRVLEPGNKDSVDYAQAKACRALAARGRSEHFERIVHHLENDDFHYGWIAGALARIAQLDPARFNSQLFALVRPNLSKTNKSIPEIFWAIWSADIREAQPDLERLATQDPSEYENEKASSSGGAVSQVRGRFHLARKIVSLWSEPDPLTQAKLLATFGAMNVFVCCLEPQPERLTRLKMEMNRVSETLSPDAKASLSRFLEAIDSNPDALDPGRLDLNTVRKAVGFARKELRL